MAKAIDPLARVLLMLLRDGSAPRSAAGARALASMQTLIDSGAIEIVRRGAGDALQIASRSALDRYIAANYPAGLNWAVENPTRADAAIYARNSKRGRVPFSLLTFHGRAGRFVPIGQEEPQALQYGVPTSIFLDDPDQERPVFSGVTSVALVENIEIFRYYLAAGIEADMAFWTAGRMSDRFLSWLGSPAWTASILHCGDYDVVGLREFDRVYRMIGARATLFVPPNIEVLFAHGTGDLLDSQRDGQFHSLLAHADAGCRQVANLIVEHGRGLEQEALLGAAVPP